MADRELVDRLTAPAAGATPPPDLGARIRREVGRRRRRRRALAGSAAAVVAVVAGATAVRPPDRTPPPPAAATAAGTPALTDPIAQRLRTGPPPRSTRLAELFPGRTPRRVHRPLGGRAAFRAFLVTPAGSFVGVGQAFDPAGFDSWTRLEVRGADGRSTSLPRPELASFASDGRYVTWLAHTRPADKFNLICHDLRTGARRQVSSGSVQESSVRVEAGRIAWTYYPDPAGTRPADGQAVVVEGCGGTEQVLPEHGTVLALRWPYVYLSHPGGGLTRYDTVHRRGETVPLGQLPRAPAGWTAAVGPETVLWAALDDPGRPTALRARNLRTGRDVPVATGPPVRRGHNGATFRLTAGDRLLAYASSPIDGPPGDSRGIVYDPRTNTTVALPGEAFVAGGWLAWLDGDDYWLLDVS